MARTSSAPSHLYSRCLLHNPTEKTDGEKRVEEEERRCDDDMEVRERGGARSRDRSAAHPFPCQKGRPSHMLAHPPFPAFALFSSIKKAWPTIYDEKEASSRSNNYDESCNPMSMVLHFQDREDLTKI
jgi:hypothetical protein